MRTRASIKVQVVLEVDVGSAWGPDSTIEQVRSQGVTSAEGIIRRALEGGEPERKALRIVGLKAAEITIRREES